MSRQPTCDERIADQLASRLRHLAALGELRDIMDADELDGLSAEAREIADEHGIPLDADSVTNDSTREAAMEATSELPLAVTLRRVVRIELSTGGPADWLEIQLDEENTPGRAEYHFADWFDHASRPLDGPEYDAAIAFAEHVTGGFYFPSADDSPRW